MQLLEYDMIVLPFKNSFFRFRKIKPTGSTSGVYAPSVSPFQQSRNAIKDPSGQLRWGAFYIL